MEKKTGKSRTQGSCNCGSLLTCQELASKAYWFRWEYGKCFANVAKKETRKIEEKPVAVCVGDCYEKHMHQGEVSSFLSLARWCCTCSSANQIKIIFYPRTKNRAGRQEGRQAERVRRNNERAAIFLCRKCVFPNAHWYARTMSQETGRH